MKVQKEDFQEAFKMCDAVQASPVLETSQFIRLKQNGKELSLSLTGSLWAESKVSASEGTGKWTAWIDRRALKAFLNTAIGVEVELFYKDKLILKSGQRLEVALRSAISGYETWTPTTTFDLTDDQKAVLKTAVKYLPNAAGAENLEAVYFGSDIIVTDSLFMLGVMESSVKNAFFLPSEVARFLTANGGSLAVDKNGIGVSLGSGFVYQPLSSKLKNYPVDKCKAALQEGLDTIAVARVRASELLSALSVASQFLIDKLESATAVFKGSSIILTVDLSASKFQRIVPTLVTGASLDAPVSWPLRKIIPWFEYAVSVKDDIEIEFAKTSNASAFRFEDGPRKNVFLSADV